MSNKKYSHFEDDNGNKTMTAQVDGYDFGDRLLEGIMFNITIESDGSLTAEVEKSAEGYFEDLNKEKWLKEALRDAESTDIFHDANGADTEWFLVEQVGNTSVTNGNTQPHTIVAKTILKPNISGSTSMTGTTQTPAQALQAALGITQNQGASKNLQSNLGNPFAKIDAMFGEDGDKKTEERDEAIDKLRDVANTGLKLGRSSRGDLAEVVLELYNLDDLSYAIPGTRVVMVERKKAGRIAGIEHYAIEEIIENCDTHIILSNCDDEENPRKISYSQMRQDSANGTAILKYEANEIGDLMDIHFLKYKIKPINKLMSLFEEDEAPEQIEVNDSHLSKLDSLFADDEVETEKSIEPVAEESKIDTLLDILNTGEHDELLGETKDRLVDMLTDSKAKWEEEDRNESKSKLDELLDGVEETVTEPVEEVEEVKEVVAPLSHAAQMIQDSVNKMNEEKLAELQERIDEKKKDIKKYQYEEKLAKQRAKTAETDMDVLYSRLMQMQPKKAANGHSFSVGVMDEQTLSMEVVITPTKSTYDADTFKDAQLPASVKKELEDLGLVLQSVGQGESTWKQVGITPELMEKAKAGEITLKKSDFKAYHEMKLELSKAGFAHDGGLDDYISKQKEQLCANSLTGNEEADNETRQSLGLFDTLNGVTPNDMGAANIQMGPNTVMPFGNPYTTQPVNIKPTGNGMQVQKPACTHQGCDCEETEEDTNAISEMDEAFEEEMGTKLSDEEFIFSIMIDPNATNDVGEPEAIIGINPLSFWDKNGYQYDQHIEVILRKKYPVLQTLGMKFEEVQEGCFDMLDSDNWQTAKHISTRDTVENLCKSGVKFKRNFQDFMSQKDTQTIENMIIQLGYQHLII